MISHVDHWGLSRQILSDAARRLSIEVEFQAVNFELGYRPPITSPADGRGSQFGQTL
jgi:hypothetical protein